MTRLELPLFPIMLVLSVLAHGAAFVLLTGEPVAPPELIPSQPGVASIKLVSSDAARAQPTDLLADLPILEDAVNPPLPEPALAEPRQQVMDRPRELEPTPTWTSETKVVTPTEVPELTADLIPRLTTPAETAQTTAPKHQLVERPRVQVDPKVTTSHRMVAPAAVPDLRAELTPLIPPPEMVKKHDPLKPVSMPRPKTEKVELPTLETITKVSDRVAVASPASQEMEGVVDLPQKLAINPPPRYPPEANGQLGTVTLLVTVSAEGHVSAISIYSSSGVQALDDSALSAVRRWVFAPARRDGRPIPFDVHVPIVYFRR